MQASAILFGQCKERFITPFFNPAVIGGGGPRADYQGAMTSPWGTGAFALAIGNGEQACAWRSNQYQRNQASSQSLDVIINEAISDCEVYRRQRTRINSPCRLFAINNDIVWNDPSRSISLPSSNPSPAPVAPAYNPPQQFIPSAETRGESLDSAKAKCADLGFKTGTQKFGECVLKLSR